MKKTVWLELWFALLAICGIVSCTATTSNSDVEPSDAGQWAKIYKVDLWQGSDHWSTDWSFGLYGAIHETKDNGYVLVTGMHHYSENRGCTLVLKLNSLGNIEWKRAYGEHWTAVWHSIQQTQDDGYIVSTQTTSFGAGDFDIMIFKLDALGAIEWQRTYGGTGHEVGYCDIQETNDGGYIGGSCSSTFSRWGGWLYKLNPSGDIDWERYYDDCEGSDRVLQTGDGGYIVKGGYYSDDRLGTWLLKLTSAGDSEWQRFYDTGESGATGFTSIHHTGEGGYVLSIPTDAYGAGETDILIVKLDALGAIEWQRTYGGSGTDRHFSSHSVEQTSDGGYIVGATTNSFGAGSFDMWVLKLTPIGAIEWQRTYGGKGREELLSVEQTDDGGYIVAGWSDSFDYGSAWHSRLLVLKLSPTGEIGHSCGIIGSSNALISDISMATLDTNLASIEPSAITMNAGLSPFEPVATGRVVCSESSTQTLSAGTEGTTHDLDDQ